MSKITEVLQGKKTYIIVAIAIISVAIEKFAGIDLPGFDPGDDWLGYILAAAGLGSLRAGIGK